jgi:polyhydroxyalkanoate synthesis regulator phasin
MIIVETPPQIVYGQVSAVSRVKLITSATKVRIATYDALNGKLISESYSDITTSTQEILATFNTPTYNTIVIAVIEAQDNSGNVLERWSRPFIYLPNATVNSIPPSQVVYISKIGGITAIDDKAIFNQASVLALDPTVFTIVKRQGYLAMYDGTTKILEVSGKSAIVKLQFKVSQDIAKFLANAIDNADISKIVYKAPEIAEWIGAWSYVKLISQNLGWNNLGNTVYRDTNGFYIVNVRFAVDLYSSFDWSRVLHLLTSILAIIGGVAMIIASVGFSAPISTMLIATGIVGIATGTATIVYDSLIEQTPSNILDQAKNMTASATDEINNYYTQLKQYLDSLVNQGKITSDEENKILNYVDNIRTTALDTFAKLQDMIDNAYKQGYEKAKSEMMTYIAMAGLGGFVIGSITKK